MQGIDLSTRLQHLSPQQYLTYKIICGDKSDNIQPVFRRCGQKKACILAADLNQLSSELKNKHVENKYKHNDLLINFDNIPEDVRSAVLSDLQMV